MIHIYDLYMIPKEIEKKLFPVFFWKNFVFKTKGIKYF